MEETVTKVLGDILERGPLIQSNTHPEWATPEKTTEWVRALREEADRGSTDKIGHSNDDDQTSA